MKYDFLIVGAGITGITLANILADAQKKVLIIDKRNHIGGNCYDRKNSFGIYVQDYGPHIFYINIKEVWDYLNRFTKFNNYVH